MAFQTWQEHHFSRHVTITNRESVNYQAGAARFNDPVQMGTANPFATTTENPWLGMNHMLLGSSSMVVQEQTNATMTSTHSGPANSPPADDDRRKRPRASMEDRANNFNIDFPALQSPALESIKSDMIGLMETERMLAQEASIVFVDY